MDAEKYMTAARNHLEIRRLDKALEALKEIYDNKANLVGYDEYKAIENDYTLMCEYMLKGYQDSQREKLFHSLIVRLFKVIAELQLSWNCKHKGFFSEAFGRQDHLNLAHNFVKTVLENYVSDVAMLSLEAATTRQIKEKELYQRHHTFIDRLFNAIFTSTQWKKADADFYTELLLSPTIDTNDQMLIVSAITMACMNIFDLHKLETLVHTHREAIDEKVKQRAFVGWVLSLTDNAFFYDEQHRLLDDFLSKKSNKRELLILQKQFFNCMNAERDNAKIERDIMPNIMKNSDIKFNRFGIEEREDDPLESIMNPDADEKKMEAMEENIQKMMQMQQQGADIYFGGFSKMKRYPFFDNTANWFMPFYVQHPGLSEVRSKLGDAQILDKLANNSPFCESDKYSLALTISQIVNQLPPSMLEILKSGEGIGFQETMPFDVTPDFIRRMYIQDLYRFFKVKIVGNGEIENPFVGKIRNKAFFLAKFFFCQDEFKETNMQLARFLYKHKYNDQLDLLLDMFFIDSPEYHLLVGQSCIRNNDRSKALDHFLDALNSQDNNEWVMKNVGAAALKSQMYEVADHCYTTLCEMQPENKKYAINFALTKIFLKEIKTALNKLYEWDLKEQTDNYVKRILAWALLCDGKPQKAFGIYEKLAMESPLPDDFLNMGYAYWINNNPSEARNYFKQWKVTNRTGDIEAEFANDSYMLDANGISQLDRTLMISAIEM